MNRTVLVFPLLATISAVAATQEPAIPVEAERVDKERLRALSERAKRAESTGDRAEAVKAYEAVRAEKVTPTEAEVGSDVARLRVNATLQSARNLEMLASSDAAPAARLVEARARYEEVITQGDAGQKLAARNALGVLLLRQGQKAEALATLKQIDLAAVPAAQAFVFHSNLGRAYEESGQAQSALTEYKASLEQQASFLPAQQGAFRLLQRREPAPLADAIALIGLLTKKGEVRAAADRTRELLVAWQGQPGAIELLPPLARNYAAARVAPSDFLARDWPSLAKVSDPTLRASLDQLRHAYQDDLPFSTDRWSPPRDFSAWARPLSRARSMAALLRFRGDFEDAADRPRQALALYWTAWLLDRDPDYAVATLSVLEAHPELQAGPVRVFDTLIATLFDTKGDAYARQDWPSIVRLHVILAGIFERQGHWGPEFGAQGAVFQWENAARAAVAARREHPDIGPAPGIHLGLAACYRHLGRFPEAWGEYVEAAEAFLSDGRPADARKAVTETASLGWRPSTTADELRLKRLETEIAAHER